MSDDDQAQRPTLLGDGGDYDLLVADLRRIIGEGRGRAAAAVNAEIVATYWRIGERIVVGEQGGRGHAAYGEQVLARLGRTLSAEHGRAFGERNLRFMRQFYATYPNRNALRTALGWTHYRTLMRLPDEQRAFYERVAVQGRWSSRELDRQINSMLYERAALSRQPERTLADAMSAEGGQAAGAMGAASVADVASTDSSTAAAAADAFKDPYVLDFLGLEDTFSEKDLEGALIRHIERFLVELGAGFYFGGRQRRITIGGEDFYVDLVFWHRYLNCHVYIDLKVGAIAPADIAQMRLYLNWAKRHDTRAGEDDPIGLILCGSKNEQVIELLLADSDSTTDRRIRVAQYLLLDGEDALRKRLAEIAASYDEARSAEVDGGSPSA